ncbi:hypothetical protein [Mycoplasma sp. Ms02]|uniref:hypothetical protein n=1 Tax=Mycoplasma sp. Ms02 TaxID=353851 RepID=UPI001C8908DF|nr:hypothetical protein [Mycoplasma sp. Ms02]QZE12415.1 hypothetical protein K4L35_00265 [Mycoplasma sp. Ms02]
MKRKLIIGAAVIAPVAFIFASGIANKESIEWKNAKEKTDIVINPSGRNLQIHLNKTDNSQKDNTLITPYSFKAINEQTGNSAANDKIVDNHLKIELLPDGGDLTTEFQSWKITYSDKSLSNDGNDFIKQDSIKFGIFLSDDLEIDQRGSGKALMISHKARENNSITSQESLGVLFNAITGQNDDGTERDWDKTFESTSSNISVKGVKFYPEIRLSPTTNYNSIKRFQDDYIEKISEFASAERFKGGTEGIKHKIAKNIGSYIVFNIEKEAKSSDGAPVLSEFVIQFKTRKNKTNSPSKLWLKDYENPALSNEVIRYSQNNLYKSGLSFVGIASTSNNRLVKIEGLQRNLDIVPQDPIERRLQENTKAVNNYNIVIKKNIIEDNEFQDNTNGLYNEVPKLNFKIRENLSADERKKVGEEAGVISITGDSQINASEFNESTLVDEELITSKNKKQYITNHVVSVSGDLLSSGKELEILKSFAEPGKFSPLWSIGEINSYHYSDEERILYFEVTLRKKDAQKKNYYDYWFREPSDPKRDLFTYKNLLSKQWNENKNYSTKSINDFDSLILKQLVKNDPDYENNQTKINNVPFRTNLISSFSPNLTKIKKIYDGIKNNLQYVDLPDNSSKADDEYKSYLFEKLFNNMIRNTDASFSEALVTNMQDVVSGSIYRYLEAMFMFSEWSSLFNIDQKLFNDFINKPDKNSIELQEIKAKIKGNLDNFETFLKTNDKAFDLKSANKSSSQASTSSPVNKLETAIDKLSKLKIWLEKAIADEADFTLFSDISRLATTDTSDRKLIKSFNIYNIGTSITIESKDQALKRPIENQKVAHLLGISSNSSDDTNPITNTELKNLWNATVKDYLKHIYNFFFVQGVDNGISELYSMDNLSYQSSNATTNPKLISYSTSTIEKKWILWSIRITTSKIESWKLGNFNRWRKC